MAQKVVVTLFDDIDGSEAAETIAFGLDGKSYEIDLNEPMPGNCGRRSSLRGRRPQAVALRQGVPADGVAPDPAAVRAWARPTGWTSPRGGGSPRGSTRRSPRRT